ncbi:hypothetical protein K505DRAFT_320174 [Melanomma pulvis-pyrius CBS 109.77]|uniref:Transcription factor Rba50 n=1 Tax=Melanomma pulvis-pyrius CBS 109.77 TaxID=1314802 RepID=A0A6A6XYY1_9PLEO|nr:hypothetical protein K505DRAFT_320174 [Melanomma pulvis-pyrius CBS 109.77]
MSFARGERVHFDFDSGTIESAGQEEHEAPLPASTAFVGDILERAPSTANPPSAPTFKAKANTTGFPAHKKRVNRVSAFKQQRATKNDASQHKENGAANPSNRDPNFQDDERRRIDEENRQRIASMSAEEIEEERNELLSSLPPSLIQKLLGRANLDDGSNEQDLNLEAPATRTTDEDKAEKKPPSTKKVTFDMPNPQNVEPSSAHDTPSAPSTLNVEPPSTNTTDASQDLDQLPSSIHFPTPPQPPDLDPNSTTFLTDLHEKYFPNLAYDPSSLSWMTPIDPSDTTSPYHPSQIALNASELRFDFNGALLAPSRAREIEVTKGLHHHADAPEAAGYTIPELSRLSRSAVPAQRCMAYQTLGRILYRLGKGEFGEEVARENVERPPVQVVKDPNVEGEGDSEGEEEDVGTAMARGLWTCMEDGRVVETLTEEAAREKGHLTAKTYAQEALWNWRRGGGRKRQAV